MNNNDRQELELLTKKYFAGETSSAEEKRLREQLANDRGNSSEDSSETAAVAGFFATQRNSARKKRRERRNIVRVAAMLAASVATGAMLFIMNPLNQSDGCVAYINGVEATESDAAIAVMISQINEISGMADAADREMENAILNFTTSLQ